MSRFFFTLVLCLIFNLACAQEKVEAPIEVALLGVYHFDNPGLDVINKEVDDYFAPERQKQLEELNARLATLQPDKIFIERRPNRQALIDSLYNAFKQGQLSLQSLKRGRSEVFQIGFKLAKSLNLKQLYCSDAPGIFPFGIYQEKQEEFQLKELQELEAKMMRDMQEEDKEEESTIMGNLIKMNRPENILENHYWYNAVAPRTAAPQINDNQSVVKRDTTSEGVDTYVKISYDYIGAELVGEWYKRNLKIYSNIIRNTAPNDKRILVIYGAGHIRILRHLFEDNPAYRVVEINDFLE